MTAHEGYRCPTCGAGVPPGAPARPFCSDRCKWVDLGHWLTGRYKIPGGDEPDEVSPPPPLEPPVGPARSRT